MGLPQQEGAPSVVLEGSFLWSRLPGKADGGRDRPFLH